MSNIKHKTRFAIGDRVSSRVQPDFQGTIVAASPNGFTVAWSNGFTMSESAASLMPAGSVDKYKCEMMERQYTCTITRDGECILATVDESCAEILTAELNALAADNERLRDALVDAATALGAWGILLAFPGCPKPEGHDAALAKATNALKHHTG